MLQSLPSEARGAFAALWSQSPAEVSALHRTVSAHRAEVEAAAAKNEFLDTTLSEAIATGFDAVLAGWAELPPTARAAMAAAVAYYALSEDAEDDLDSVLGFEDDAHVFNACARFIGRADLCIEIE